ncbi:HAD-IIIC family phosphatase [Acetobacter oeni]|uniref:Methoxymalonyl-ACP biosynthesis protein FkbH n=1 Tax=Acetobacter oeni TaxID=304077 RepID=A0A511XI25_9PROT|nr:HAD-IIIC family phosphatase [Acetobacter oeni]MBB3882990.1 FkbH-like protein [Acetobacter oeni]GBR11731.1 FkbH-like protein [Acetobacter oeni LMG 21952]GEN62574.1 methoxymalonyl-ACP biosynthesis protein FkbH [Acetobacter oeni]
MAEIHLSAKTIPALADILTLGTRIVAGAWPLPETDKLRSLRVHVMGTATTDMLARAIAVGCAQENVRPTISQSLYGSFMQDVLNPASELYTIRPDIAVIVSEWRSLVSDLPPSASEEDVAKVVDGKVSQILSVWKRISQDCGSKIIHHFPPPPPFRLTGIAETYLPASYTNQLRQLVQKLWSAETSGVQIIDFGEFALEHGLLKAFTPGGWYSAKLPIETGALPAYIPLFRSALRGALNTVKKALVLDLDNTIWGGVIGDDGVDGIKIGSGDAISEAYQAFQQYVKLLANRGIILAVCSKNNPDVAKTGFDKPGSILKVEDFAAFEASWEDKANGLRKIAKQINIGLDSLVFVDDNPAECALVRQELPEVATVLLDGEPADFITQVEQGYWFQFQKYSREDFGRTAAYTMRAAAIAEQDSASDLPSYLRGLEMIGTAEKPTEAQIERVVQLGQKTNQFNLLTQRFDTQAVHGFLDNADNIVLACTLKDKFGDHGLVSVLLAERKGSELDILEWTMSCRVFSRSFEQFIMNALFDLAKKKGVEQIVGRFKPTAKNAVVSDLYERLGFTSDGEGCWVCQVADNHTPLQTFITAG